jgi:GT2 family glycosyltransferase
MKKEITNKICGAKDKTPAKKIEYHYHSNRQQNKESHTHLLLIKEFLEI